MNFAERLFGRRKKEQDVKEVPDNDPKPGRQHPSRKYWFEFSALADLTCRDGEGKKLAEYTNHAVVRYYANEYPSLSEVRDYVYAELSDLQEHGDILEKFPEVKVIKPFIRNLVFYHRFRNPKYEEPKPVIPNEDIPKPKGELEDRDYAP